ncbi:ribonuclease H-like domain-containing protein, partial [Tanacetum coccineum]
MIYNMHHKIYTLTQSGISLSEYYHECNSLWRKFDSLVDLPTCTCEGSPKLKEHAQLLRLMQFFMGLDDVFNYVRSIILTTEPIHDVKYAFTTLSRDESPRKSDHSKSTAHSLTSNQYQRLMYLLSDTGNASNSHASIAGFNSKVPDGEWLGNPSDQVLIVLKNKIKDLTNTSSGPCDVCHKAKQTREPFQISEHRSKSLSELVHLDVWGPYKVNSREGYRFFLTVVDDYSRTVYVFLMKSKIDVFDHIVDFTNLIKNQFEKNVKVFGSDNENGITELTIFDSNLESNETYDDGETVQTLIRKNTRKEKYATKTSVSEGIQEYETETHVSEVIQSTSLNDDEYEYEGEDIESFGQLFGWSPELTVGQIVRRTSRKPVLSSKYNDCVLNNNVNRWVDAMNLEMEVLNRNRTWDIVDLPSNRKSIESKWVFRVKYKANGEVEKFKARFGDDEPLTVHCLIQVMHSPIKSYLRLVFRVLRYLKKESGLGITFKESKNANLRVFVDSDWAKCK